MNFVEPIKDLKKLQEMSEYLKQKDKRNYIMFYLGIYSGLRISDILRLRVIDVLNKDYFYIKEKKTGKERKIPINKQLKREIKKYCENKSNFDYLIKSREGYNRPITPVMAWNIISNLGKTFGLDRIGTHSLRKTFGYHYYNRTKDIALLQKIFNHSHPSITLRYIGVEQEEINKAMENFKLF